VGERTITDTPLDDYERRYTEGDRAIFRLRHR
jgi:hypothetical protein